MLSSEPPPPSFISSEMYAAVIGALVTFILAVIWQYFTDRRNKIQLVFSKKIEAPLNIPATDLKEKLEILYDGKKIKDVFYAKLTIKNTGQKTVKKQIFRCEFDKEIALIDETFPIISTNPEKEIYVEKMAGNNQNDLQSHIYRYQIEKLGPGNSIQIDFLFDGENKTFDVSFAPNDTDEVKILERNSSSDPNLEYYIGIIGFDIFLYIALINIGDLLGYLGTSSGLLLALSGLPFLYHALLTLKKLVPLIIENISNEKPEYKISIGDSSASSQNVIIGAEGTVNIRQEKPKKDNDKSDKKRKNA